MLFCVERIERNTRERERESCSRATKERRRVKEREGLPPAALLLYAIAALCSNEMGVE